MGGFSAPCIFNEDMIFAGRAIKLGYSVAYVAEARVIHSHNYSAMQQFHRYFDNGVSQAMHPEVFRGIHSEREGGRLVKNTIKYHFFCFIYIIIITYSEVRINTFR